MSKSFERDLRLAVEDVDRMAGLVADAVRGGVRALCDRDPQAAAAVLAGDDEIDQLENAVTEHCTRLLALHQPGAGCLRRVVALLQVATELERIGDLARGVAARARRMDDLPPFPTPDLLFEMADRVVGMVDAGVGAFLADDTRLARDVRGRDDAVDADHAAVLREVIDRMKECPERVEAGLSLVSAVRHLERIADHATNVAEDPVFAAEGEVIRHRHPDPAGNDSYVRSTSPRALRLVTFTCPPTLDGQYGEPSHAKLPRVCLEQRARVRRTTPRHPPRPTRC